MADVFRGLFEGGLSWAFKEKKPGKRPEWNPRVHRDPENALALFGSGVERPPRLSTVPTKICST